MARQPSVSTGHLMPLGAAKLAEVLVELAETHKDVKKRMERLLAVKGSGKNYTGTLRKQIADMVKKRRFYEYNERNAYAVTLDGIRRSIVADLMPVNPASAADLLREFLEAGFTLIECVEDSGNKVFGVFEQTCTDWATAWQSVERPDIGKLADELLEVALRDGYGFTASAVEHFAAILSGKGLNLLEQKIRKKIDALPKPTGNPKARKMHVMLGRNADSAVAAMMLAQMEKDANEAIDFTVVNYAGQALVPRDEALRGRCVDLLRDVADAKCDVDLYIEAVRMEDQPSLFAVDIAERLLNAKRPEEALEVINQAPPPPDPAALWELGYADDADEAKPIWLKIKILEALKKPSESQDLRWRSFARFLDERFYVDFVDHAEAARHDDIRVDAIKAAREHRNIYIAMRFLTWLRDAAVLKRFVLDQRGHLNGDHYRALTPAADFLADGEPETAALLYRLMTERVLEKGASKYYVYAAHNLRKAERCARHFRDDDTTVESHADFEKTLREKHKRKRGFWDELHRLPVKEAA